MESSIHWLPFGIILGILFILMFYLIGHSSQKAGITVTTLANKLSLVFPVLFSLIYFNEHISTLKYIGLGTATIAVLLTVYKKNVKKTNLLFVILPLLIFLGSGLVDSIVKYVQAVKISENEVTLYTTVVFFVAFLCGIFFSAFTKSKKFNFQTPTLLLGILLGVANFGSLYFFMNALNKTHMDSSLVFALNNMSIVAFTTLLGTLLFNEKLNKINFAGIVLAILSLYLLL
ncbi:EamA family transporter [Prolixibacteraceae bacterium Z1-6]|uniref:EamA family transporter n=1 Tax=Draconibacterium aestuarii TaxID=2998507 RepID=A0A9X3FCE2_9BACT|nr:EamA family transporter [Prolixibacteraceae bacterium Z1-6]